MKKGEGYKLKIAAISQTIEYRFTSVGKKGEIKKIIEFAYLGENLWNLGFGDVKGSDWEDNIISDNNDFRKVLQTVANTVHYFYEKYPDHNIQILPIDYQRKLLYNRVFQQKWHEIEPLFIVMGIIKNEEDVLIYDYEPSKIFDEFVISKKK